MRHVTFILALILASSAIAVPGHAGCKKQCDDRIAECVATGKTKKKCRKQVLRTCRREGLDYCITPVATFCCVDACPSGDCVIRQRCTAPLGQTCCVGTETGLFIEKGTCKEYLPTCLEDTCG